jgi:DNA-binding PadR family transcriptional regulator
VDNGREWRYYSLTPKGRHHLTSQRKQWALLQKGIGMILNSGEATEPHPAPLRSAQG